MSAGDRQRRQGCADGCAGRGRNEWEINSGLTMKLIDRWQRRCAVGLGLLLLAAVAQARTNPLAKGSDPTSTLLNASAGPFAIANTSVSASSS